MAYNYNKTSTYAGGPLGDYDEEEVYNPVEEPAELPTEVPLQKGNNKKVLIWGAAIAALLLLFK